MNRLVWRNDGWVHFFSSSYLNIVKTEIKKTDDIALRQLYLSLKAWPLFKIMNFAF